MTFEEAIKLGFLRYADFTSRSSRSEFWYWVLFLFVAYVVLFGALLFGGTIGAGLALLFMVATFVPTLAVIVRRFHDIGISGWWAALVYAVPIIFSVSAYSSATWFDYSALLASLAVIAAWLLASAMPGEADDNYWGTNPLG